MLFFGITARKGAIVGSPENWAELEDLEKRGFLRFVREVPGYRRYQVTERGAGALGLGLAED